jgi:hypothetical protein
LEFKPINETVGNTINTVSDNPEPPLDLSNLKNEIRRCPDFAPMVEYLADGKLPADDEKARKVLLERAEFRIVRRRFNPSVFAAHSKHSTRKCSNKAALCTDGIQASGSV